MLNCKAVHKHLMDSVVDELAVEDYTAIKAHGDHCEKCRHLIFEFSESSKFIDELQQRVELSDNEIIPKLDDLWTRLEPAIDQIDKQRIWQLTHSRNRWKNASAVLAVAACLILVVGITFSTNNQNTNENIVNSSLATTSNSAIDLRQYLNRAQPILATLANTNTYDGFVPIDKGYAQVMALEAQVLATGHESELSVSQQQLLRDVQYLLAQYANLQEGDMQSGLEVLQYFLGNNTVLFRMSLAEMRDEIPVI